MVKQGNLGIALATVSALQNPPRRQELWKVIASTIRQTVTLLIVLVLSLILLQQADTAWASPRTAHANPAAKESNSPSQMDMNRSAESRSHKRLGDRYLSENEIKLAATAYHRALSLDREQFDLEERVEMAVCLSWADRLRVSIREFQLVLAEDPAYLSARIHLARTYGWARELNRSIAEADDILAEQPDNKDALLIKAKALEWQGRYSESTSLYEKIIDTDGDFDAQTGLSPAPLDKGDHAGAARQAEPLTTEDPHQQQKLHSLLESINSEISPRMDIRYNRYADGDHDLFHKYTALYNIPLGNQELILDMGHTESLDGERRAKTDDWAAPQTSPANSVAKESNSPSQMNMNRSEEARSQKGLGDRHISENEIKLAATAYQRALSLDRQQFDREERVQMAVCLSWDDRLKVAIREFQLVLAEDPAYLSAHVHLARTYGWAGDLNRSIAEADEILAEHPDNKDALLIKAKALEWQGRYSESISLYEEIIDTDGDFDAQVGLSSALLYKGDRAGAARKAKLLTAEDPRQQRELHSLLESIKSEIRPRMDIRYNRYADGDHNLFHKYTARYNIPIGNEELIFDMGHTESLDEERRAKADDFSLQAQFNHAGSVGFGGAFGLSRLHAGSTAQHLTGQIRLEGRLPHTTLALTMASTMLTDTSELIENSIRRTSAGVKVLQQIHNRISLSGAYSYMRFSDGNNANDVQMQSEYRISSAPRLTVGYRGRYLDFERQSRSGFFDPDNYVSHRIYSGFHLKRPKFYIDFEVYYGKQDFKRYGERTNDWITGGAGSFGITPFGGFVLEVNASGGDFAAGSVSGFRYFTLGSLVSYRF